MHLSESIGIYKKQNNMTILQPHRWDQVLGKSIKKGMEKNLRKKFVSGIFKIIHQESIHKQTEKMNNE